MGLGPHNMLVELLLAFGIVIGGIMAVWFISLYFQMFSIRDYDTKMLVFMFAAYCFTELFVEGDWTLSPQVFTFMALCIDEKIRLK